jgi:tetratricopeptide (TPR) repeat protein
MAFAEQFRKLSEESQMSTEGEKKPHDREDGARVAAQIYADAARVRGRHGEAQRAEDFLLRAVLLQPLNTHFLTQLQKSLQQRGAHAEAVEVGERIVELAPKQLDQWLNLVWLYSNLDQPDRAIAACKKAIELNPEDPRCRRAYEIIQRSR